MLALTSGRGFADVKGVIEALVGALDPAARIAARPTAQALLDRNLSCELWLTGVGGERLLGYLGEVSVAGLKAFELRGATTVAEVRLATLIDAAKLIPQQGDLSIYPAVARDLNLELAETIAWAQIERTVRQSAGENLESLEFREDYRNRKQVPAGKKRLLFSITLRSRQATLTSEEADQVRDRIVLACHERFGASLVQ